ncbi:GTP-binding protein [Peterkaempfera bronchialis]|uniref:GTP-binding protein n=1 Tax=Peterkaempfera bronchialis TaxID=2126346 RepID=UPI003C2FD108
MQDSRSSDVAYLRPGTRVVKLVVAGPLGVGKTTLVAALSEIRPLHTEERMSQAGASVDDLVGLASKTTTTVALDFGRLTLNERLVLYLFGAPGQERFGSMWEDLARGALGGLVLVDTRRLADSFSAIDLVEDYGLPYTVAVNRFPDAPEIPDAQLRAALDLDPRTPLVHCDARDRTSAAEALIILVQYLLDPATSLEPA